MKAMASTNTSLLSVIQHYQRSIERSQTDEERLLYCINRLYKLPVKVEHLQETGIGKTVNSLRKFNGEIGIASKALVTKWKAMVAAEEEPMDTNCQNNDEINDTDTRKETSDEDGEDNVQSSYNNDIKNMNSAKRSRNDTDHSKNQTLDSSKEREGQKHSDNIRTHVEKSRSNEERPISHSTKPVNELHHKPNEKLEKATSRIVERGTENHHDKAKQNNEKRKEGSGRHKESSHHKSKHHSSSKTKLEDSDNISASNENCKHDPEKLKRSSKSTTSSSSISLLNNHKEKHSHKKSKDGKTQDSSEKSENKRDEIITSSKSSHSSDGGKASTSSDRKRHRESNTNIVEPKSPTAKEAKVQKISKLAVNKDEEIADDGIDSSMGANFADVLGMLNKPTKKSKKQQQAVKSSPNINVSSVKITNTNTSSSSNAKINGYDSLMSSSSKAVSTTRSPDAKPALLSSSTKLEPLDPSIALELPIISNNYRPLPYNPTVMDCVFKLEPRLAPSIRTFSEADALSHGISSKTMRTKIYSGVKTGQIHQVPSLFDLCIRVLQKNIDALEYTGGVPFEVLRPVLERASPQQLLTFEDFNPYMLEDSDVLWHKHVQRNHRTEKREEMESWREMFLRCQENQDRKLSLLAESIKQSQKVIAAPVRKTQMAFVDTMVKPPRNVVRKQEQYGTKCKPIATPAARVAALSSVIPNATKTGDARLRVATTVRDAAQVSACARPKKAPLMAKTLQFMRGHHKR